MVLFLQFLCSLILHSNCNLQDYPVIGTTTPSTSNQPRLQIISRAEWGARPPTIQPTPIPDNLPYIFIHHTYEPDQCFHTTSCIAAVRAIQNYHMDIRGWDDIGYSFLVADDGNIYEGRGWNIAGAHTYHYNKVGYGIAIIGNFTSKLPTLETLQLVKRLIEFALFTRKIETKYCLRGHRDALGAATECPGDELYSVIQKWHNYGNVCPNPTH